MLLFWEAKEWTTAIENIYERERERDPTRSVRKVLEVCAQIHAARCGRWMG